MSRSNTSLELVYSEYLPPSTLRREYGSHGSIDVIGGDGVSENNFFTMVQGYNDQNRVGNQNLNAETPFSRPRVQAKSEIPSDDYLSMENVSSTVAKTQTVGTSPKLRLKFHKFWSNNGQSNFGKSVLDDCSLTMNSVHENFSSININGDADEQHKRRHFAHYDCQSLVANLGYAAKLRSMLLSRRRNTTTGASAASLLQSRVSASTDILSGVDSSSDAGDGRYNDLVESCPFFRNEIGGEEERCVSLCWRTSRTRRSNKHYYTSNCWHRPAGAYGLSILEFPTGQSHWKQPCPYYLKTSNGMLPIESQDQGALYYRKYFYGQDHQNWFGMDDQLGPVAISIKKERVELPVNVGSVSKTSPIIPNSNLVWQYRLIIRTSELFTLRGSVLEDAITTVKPSNNSKNYSTKDVLEYVAPEIQLSCLRLGSIQGVSEDQLLRLDEQCVTRHYKVGIMYCKKDQATEEEMYNNQEAGPAFIEFLQSLGQTVRLKGFDKYKAGLDNKTDSTGLYSVYTTYQDCEIMFHVSTMLPYTPNNRQQLLRKRHIGNDIVTVVFQEPGAQPFTPKNIRSQFQHVFIIVRAINPCTENTHYSIAVSRSKEVPLFGPPIREDAVYAKGEAFTDLLLSKVINGENAAIQSPKFSTMATRTRQEYLKDLAKNYTTATALDTGQKFSLFSSLLMKGTHQQANNATSHVPLTRSTDGSLGPDALAAGAVCWPVGVQDEGAGGTPVDCFLGISTDTIVVIEEMSRQIVFVMPTRALLGWVVCGGGWVRVYYHRGSACVCGRSGDAPLLRRLKAVAPPGVGCAEECVLERNGSGQLGFHVQPDGLVTAVEPGGPAARSGLRRGARLLEVCRAAVATLAHDQLVDLLKTSAPVTVTLAPPAAPACGCDTGAPEGGVAGDMAARGAALPGRQRRKCERSFSPPRSSDSSGNCTPLDSYGTGGSARSARRSPEAAPADAVDPASRRHSSDSPLAVARVPHQRDVVPDRPAGLVLCKRSCCG